MYAIYGILDQWDYVYHKWDFRPMGLCIPYFWILDQWDYVYHMWDFRPMGLCIPYVGF